MVDEDSSVCVIVGKTDAENRGEAEISGLFDCLTEVDSVTELLAVDNTVDSGVAVSVLIDVKLIVEVDNAEFCGVFVSYEVRLMKGLCVVVIEASGDDVLVKELLALS